jgi:beta-galactosidase/beta-glucuronidase
MIAFRLMSSTAASEQGREMSDTNQPLGVKPQSVNLNGAWRFQVDPDRVGEKVGWFTADFDDTQWLPVTVPHTWSVMPEYSDYNGLGWYRLVFPVEAALSGTHLRLQFDAVFYKARVWLNGVELGEHRGGYTPFTFDVTAVARVGEDNVLALEIDNRRGTDRIPASNNPLSFDWWNYGGIVRDVRLLATSPV